MAEFEIDIISFLDLPEKELVNYDTPELISIKNEQLEKLQCSLAHFSQRQADMLLLRFSGETYDGIGRKYCLTPERVRQILIKVMARLPDIFMDRKIVNRLTKKEMDEKYKVPEGVVFKRRGVLFNANEKKWIIIRPRHTWESVEIKRNHLGSYWTTTYIRNIDYTRDKNKATIIKNQTELNKILRRRDGHHYTSLFCDEIIHYSDLVFQTGLGDLVNVSGSSWKQIPPCGIKNS